MRTAVGSRHTTTVQPAVTVHQPSIRARGAAGIDFERGLEVRRLLCNTISRRTRYKEDLPEGGFDTNHIYELIYTAKNPTVLGLGFAATRDLIAFFRHAAHDDFGTANPLAMPNGRRHGDESGHHAIIMGISQSGRYIRTLIHLGFNQDEDGHIVFDGAFAHLAPGRIPLNVRFGAPGRVYLQHEEHLFPAYESPFTSRHSSYRYH
jgi:hypothetical protein